MMAARANWKGFLRLSLRIQNRGAGIFLRFGPERRARWQVCEKQTQQSQWLASFRAAGTGPDRDAHGQ